MISLRGKVFSSKAWGYFLLLRKRRSFLDFIIWNGISDNFLIIIKGRKMRMNSGNGNLKRLKNLKLCIVD